MVEPRSETCSRVLLVGRCFGLLCVFTAGEALYRRMIAESARERSWPDVLESLYTYPFSHMPAPRAQDGGVHRTSPSGRPVHIIS